MTDVPTDQASTTDAPSAEPGADTVGTRGTTTIAEPVVAKIAALAARQVEGVESLGGTMSGALAGMVGRIRGDEHRTAGVGVEVGRLQAAVDLSLTVRYPYPLQGVTGAVRETVIGRVESLTGLEVVEVNIVITDLALDDVGDPSRSASAGPRVV